MQHEPQRPHPPNDRVPDDKQTRTKLSDRLNDRRTHTRHPDDDRLTESDLDAHERERRSTHAQMRRHAR